MVSGRQTPEEKLNTVVLSVAPDAFLKSWYGGDEKRISKDPDNVAEELTFLSVFAGRGGLKGQTIILAKRVKEGNCNTSLTLTFVLTGDLKGSRTGVEADQRSILGDAGHFSEAVFVGKHCSRQNDNGRSR